MASLPQLACVLVVCMAVLVGAPTAQAITCGQVTGSLAPCLNFLKRGGVPPPNCCAGVRAIVSGARTTPDRRTVCNCLKVTATRVPGVQARFAEALPSQCGVRIPYKISMSTNCASIRF